MHSLPPDPHAPRFPFYIPSKGRADILMSSKTLTRMGVPHYIVAEPDQVADYERSIGRMGVAAQVLELDLEYKQRYELCDSLGLTRSTGPGPARNFAWDHARAAGFEWHWVMDDNIQRFLRFHCNERVPTTSASIFRAMEDFVLRYCNVAMAGPTYFMWVPSRNKSPPFILNTRIYSCNLIRNDVPFRWRGRYNEDTILSLDMLKASWCTVEFVAFLQHKTPTQLMKGGNTAEFYHAEGQALPGSYYSTTGTLAKSQMLARVHPDVARVVFRYGRVHHHVDYRPFRNLRLVLREGIEVPQGVDEYGMRRIVRERAHSK
jgi:hypothetical protein